MKKETLKVVYSGQPTQKIEGWEERFDEEFKIVLNWVKLNCKDEIIVGFDMNNLDITLKQFIATLLKSEREKGYRQRDKEQMESDEVESAERAHATEQGYCCACGYDMTVMEGKIAEVKKELLGERFNEDWAGLIPARYYSLVKTIIKKERSDAYEEGLQKGKFIVFNEETDEWERYSLVK